MARQPKKGKPVVQYYVDGHAVNVSGNKISSIAWFNTRDITKRPTESSPNAPERISAGDLRALIIKLSGKKELNPDTEKFDVTLPNGVRLHTTVGKIIAPKPVSKAATKGTKKAATRTTAKRATSKAAKNEVKKTPAKSHSTRPKARLSAAARAALVPQAKLEGDLVRQWEADGRLGERPETPALDALEAAGPSKGAKRAAEVRGVKPTNKDRKTPRSSPKKQTPAGGGVREITDPTFVGVSIENEGMPGTGFVELVNA